MRTGNSPGRRALQPGISVITAWLAAVTLFAPVSADEVEIFVPEGHEKFALVDSLNTQVLALEQKVEALEAKLITDKKVRQDNFNVKAQYCEYLLQHRLRDTTSVLRYCKASRKYLETRMNYFRELMSTQEGNARATCFSLYRKTRTEYSAMNDVALRHLSLEQLEDDPVNPVPAQKRASGH